MNVNPKTLRRVMPVIGTIIVLTGAYFAIQIGKGYRPTTNGISGTGLLAANSFPDGAEVYLDDKLTTATDDTLSLPPGQYSITIKKEGYTPWNKLLSLKEELVTQTNASLFRSVPSLSPLTLNGASNLQPSPNGQYIAYAVASASAAPNNGLYITQLSNGNALGAQSGPRQIARSSQFIDFTKADLLWSPDSSQILVNYSREDGNVSNLLLDIDSLNTVETLPDVTVRLPLILAEWEEQIVQRETKQFALLPPEMQAIATQSATNVFFSPNDQRVMYTATASATIPDNIIPQPLSTNTQQETRTLEPGGLYVYDILEDKNFQLETLDLEDGKPDKTLLLLSDYQQLADTSANVSPTTQLTPNLSYNILQDPDSITTTFQNFRTHYSSIHVNNYQWYPSSAHLLIVLEGKIDLIEYDSTNWITLYAGPFENNFVYPWPDGNKIVILTNLNPSSTSPPNLYSVDVK